MRSEKERNVRRTTGNACVAFGVAWTAALGGVVATRAASPADELAMQIDVRVRQSAKALSVSPAQLASVPEFETLAVTSSWQELWPNADGREVRRAVEAKIWNAPIQAALAKHGGVFLPKRDKPYYINDPIVLKSGQRLVADREAEIRLVPGTNTCMVRNEHIVSGQDGPVPADARPDTQILVEGGVWTTLATSPAQSNGNEQGWPARQERAIRCHGVVLLSNVRGVVVRNLVIRESRAHAVQLSNCREFLVEGVRFEEHRRDGVHVNGPASYGVVRKIRGVTGDDFVALNAWDWKNTVPCFGPIDHVLVDGVYGNPRLNGTDEIRLLPGTKTFAAGRKLDCSVADCVFRNLRDIRTFKIYDQPNLELGRDQDFCDPIGTIKNVYFQGLVFNRAGRFQIAANVEGLTVDDVQLNFDSASGNDRNFKLIEIGPMSETYKIKPDDPATWVELFSPDRDVTVRGFRLTNVRAKVANGIRPLPAPEASLLSITDQKPNFDYPKTTPRGGKGRTIFVR
jgi:hypothetical protein